MRSEMWRECADPRFVVTLGELSDGLVRIPLVKMGRWIKGALKFAITLADMAQIVENFRRRQNGELVIDYDHASEFPERAQGQPIPAAGWLRSIDDAPDPAGVLWGEAEFTERARSLVKAKEYKYVSPALTWAARDKRTGEQQGCTLTSIALTNRPFLEDLPAIALSEAGWTLEKENTMKATSVRLADGDEMKYLVVCGECGKETSAEALPKPRMITLNDIKRDKDGRYDFAALSEAGDLIAPEVFLAQQVQIDLDEAVKSGKITPAQRPAMEKFALTDTPAFREFIRTQKPQVDLNERGISGGGGEGGDIRRLDQQISEKVSAKLAENKHLSYGQAYKAVLSENQDLARRRAALMRE